MIQVALSEVNFNNRQSALQQIKETDLAIRHNKHPSVRTLKNTQMLNWDLKQNQPLLNSIFKDPPMIFYKMANPLKDMLVRAKI